MTAADKANLLHGLYALAVQIPIALLTGYWWTTGAILVAFFVGREHAQREYKITGGGYVSGLPAWAGFTGWSRDNYMGVLWPVVAVYGAAIIAHVLRMSLE